jgi:serine/threonine protein kinase
VSLLPAVPSKDLINDMRNSVYLPRQRDFTSMRQERKAVEKAVTEGKEESSMHFSVVGSPDYMAVEVLRGDGYTSCVDFWAIGCML